MVAAVRGPGRVVGVDLKSLCKGEKSGIKERKTNPGRGARPGRLDVFLAGEMAEGESDSRGSTGG